MLTSSQCDELHPRCRRCTIASRQCIYEGLASSPGSILPQSSDRAASEASTTSSATSPVRQEYQSSSSTLSPAQELLRDTKTKYLHIELFYNFEHNTCRNLCRTKTDTDHYRKIVITHAFRRPFLMHAVLALSALQMSLGDPEQAESYKHTATVLQAKALEEPGTRLFESIDESNVVAVLLFQHVIVLYALCDLLHGFEDDFNGFMDQLIVCIHLLRGTRAVLAIWWDHLPRTELGVLLQTSNEHEEGARHSFEECKDLEKMIQEADLSAKSIEVCQISVQKLQTYFDAANHTGEQSLPAMDTPFAWLIAAPSEFVDLLDRRRPEALLILAYYAVMLHRQRDSWIVHDAGRKLLEQISTYLGKTWERHLTWPIACINAGETPG